MLRYLKMKGGNSFVLIYLVTAANGACVCLCTAPGVLNAGKEIREERQGGF